MLIVWKLRSTRVDWDREAVTNKNISMVKDSFGIVCKRKIGNLALENQQFVLRIELPGWNG